MTKLKFGAIIIDGRGKLGGHVLSKSLSGNYLTPKSSPKKATTQYQSKIKAQFRQISSAWSGLTQSNRDTWNKKRSLFARTNIFGDLKNPTGKNLHQELNLNLIISGQPKIDKCPNPAKLINPGLGNIDAWANRNELWFNITTNTTGQKLIFYATPIINKGSNSLRKRERIIAIDNGKNGGSFNKGNEYILRFGQLYPGNYIFVGLKSINSIGQSSPLEYKKVLIINK